MIFTHVWVCGRWEWLWLTIAQWKAMPHIGKKLALIKAAKVSGAILCAGGIGVSIPPLIDAVPPSPAIIRVIERRAPVSAPEPWSIAVFAVGLVGLAVGKGGRRP